MEEFPECVQNLLKREQNGIFSVLHQIISLKSKEEPFNRGYYPIVGTVSQQKEIAIRQFGYMHSWHLQYIDYTRLDIILRYFIASGR